MLPIQEKLIIFHYIYIWSDFSLVVCRRGFPDDIYICAVLQKSLGTTFLKNRTMFCSSRHCHVFDSVEDELYYSVLLLPTGGKAIKT